MTKKLIQHDAIINVPPEVAVCPYCGSKLSFCANTWIHNEDGTVSAQEIDLICVANEDEEFALHGYDTPYVVWFPVQQKVINWANETYDFDMVDWNKRLKRWCAATKGV